MWSLVPLCYSCNRSGAQEIWHVTQALPCCIYQEANLKDGICCKSKINTYLVQIKIILIPCKNKTTICFY